MRSLSDVLRRLREVLRYGSWRREDDAARLSEQKWRAELERLRSLRPPPRDESNACPDCGYLQGHHWTCDKAPEHDRRAP